MELVKERNTILVCTFNCHAYRASSCIKFLHILTNDSCVGDWGEILDVGTPKYTLKSFASLIEMQ